MSKIDLIDKKFGKLTVVSYYGMLNNFNYWNCICECGKSRTVRDYSLTKDITKSCGCLLSDILITRNKRHNSSRTIEYRTWQSMKRRCLNPNTKHYHHYGGRGITICDRWLEPKGEGFINFLEDMGLKPNRKYSLDRIDNNLGYFKENCRWATNEEQANNKRRNVKTIDVKTGKIFNTIKEAANSIKMNTITLYHQLYGRNPNKTDFMLYSKYLEIEQELGLKEGFLENLELESVPSITDIKFSLKQ